MGNEVRTQEITEFSDKNPNEKFYLLNVAEIPLGFFYVSPETCTLGWESSLDFSYLNKEALAILPAIIERGWSERDILHFTRNAHVSLILRACELHEYDLGQPEQYDKYQSAIAKSEMISFARYDIVQTRSSTSLQYSFTAEKQWPPTPESELTILLNKSRSWSAGLLDWVIEYHVARDRLRERVVSQTLSYSISNLSRSY